MIEQNAVICSLNRLSHSLKTIIIFTCVHVQGVKQSVVSLTLLLSFVVHTKIARCQGLGILASAQCCQGVRNSQGVRNNQGLRF